MLRYSKAFFHALLDSIKDGYTYYSASLTYQFLMVLGSLFMLLSFLASYLPFLQADRVVHYVLSLMPQHAEKVLARVLRIYEGRLSGSIIALFLSYTFSVFFAKSLNRSFEFVYGERLKKKELTFWLGVPLFLVFYTLALSILLILLSISKPLFGAIYQRIVELSNLLVGLLSLYMLYGAFLGFKINTLKTALLSSLLLFLLNKAFALVLVSGFSAT
jgi:hypothetical protein